MARKDDLSPHMLKAVRLAGDGGSLVRWKGGFWSSPHCPKQPWQTGGCDVPVEYVDLRTVDACLKRGVLAKGPRYDDPATLTERGAEVYAELSASAPHP